LSRAVNAFANWEQDSIKRARRQCWLNLDRSTPERSDEQSALTQLLTLRLAEAVTSRELLLRELAAIMRQETSAKCVMVTEPGEHNQQRVVIAQGCTPAESAKLASQMDQSVDEESQAAFCKKNDAVLLHLRPSHAQPATLYLSPRSRAKTSRRPVARSTNARG